MKTAAMIICLVSASFLAQAQDPSTPTDSLFVVTYTTGPTWDTSKKPMEQPYFKEHSANLGAWRKEGIITFGARYGEKGIIFITARSSVSVRERVLGDPAVVHGLFKADIQKLNPFYYGCIEKPK